jgi:hypothetical protein
MAAKWRKEYIMGDCKSSMTPSATPTLGKSVLGVFKKKISKTPPKKNFADHINAAYEELEISINDTSFLTDKFGEYIDNAETALLRLIDIKEHDLEKEKGKEGDNRLALCRLTEMARLLEHIKYFFTEIGKFTFGKETTTMGVLHLTMISRLIEHIGEIGAEYAATN